MANNTHSPDGSAAGIYSQVVENAFLVTIRYPNVSEFEAGNHLDELESLVDTMGLTTAGRMSVALKAPNSKYLVGTGKAEEIAEASDDLACDCIIFDDDLSPGQQRNWEKLTDSCVIDRREVILDIFASRASTREAALQVGLARMEYSLPRLTRAWTHLSRQRGGARGTRGEGETQLEVDRRIVLRKIARMKLELEKVSKQRETRRKLRGSVPVPTGAIVGYTNAGKSSLLNKLTGAEAFVEDKLFATLDTTTRRVDLDGVGEVVLSDTVGFIRKLPHDLVDAFKSTLEEAVTADFLIHVLDASNPEIAEHRATTSSVLRELGGEEKPQILVLNKIDILPDDVSVENLLVDFPGAIPISVKKSVGLDELRKEIETLLLHESNVCEFLFPSDRFDLPAYLHRNGKVLKEDYGEPGIAVTASVPVRIREEMKRYIVPTPQKAK